MTPTLAVRASKVPKQRWVELFRQAADGSSFQTTESAESLDKELASSRFCDLRLGKRFRRLVRQLASKLGHSIRLACQDWTNTKAAYRFLSNPRVNEEAILAGHFQATRELVKAACREFERQNARERRKLLELVVEGAIWKDGRLEVTLQEPIRTLALSNSAVARKKGAEATSSAEFEEWLPEKRGLQPTLSKFLHLSRAPQGISLV